MKPSKNKRFSERMRAMCNGFSCSTSGNEEIRIRPVHYPVVPYSKNVWSLWTKAIMDAQPTYGFVSVAIFSVEGYVNQFTDNFVPTSADLRKLNNIYNKDTFEADETVDTTVTFNHCTYAVKTLPTKSTVPQPDVTASCQRTSTTSVRRSKPIADVVEPRQLLAFNGSRYLLVSRSKTLYIVALIDSQRRTTATRTVDEALVWISGFGRRLIDKGY